MKDKGVNKYQQALSVKGTSPKALLWRNYRSSAVTYRTLVADIDFRNKTVLDAGCGMGDLLPFLYMKTVDFDYLGIDVLQEFVDIATKRYEGHRFKAGNFLETDFRSKFDIVLTSGTLNTMQPDWLEYRKTAIEKLFSFTRETLAFNMAGGFSPKPHTDKIAYSDAREILDFCRRLTSRLIIRTGYKPDEFTVVLFKQ